MASRDGRRLRWPRRRSSRRIPHRWRVSLLVHHHQRAGHRHRSRMCRPRRRSRRARHRLVPCILERLRRNGRPSAASHWRTTDLPARRCDIWPSHRDQRPRDCRMDPPRAWSFSASSDRDRLRVSFRDRGIVPRRVDPPLSDLLLAAIAGALFWALIRRVISPRASLEARVATLETTLGTMLSELRAARDGTPALRDRGWRDGFVDAPERGPDDAVTLERVAHPTELGDDAAHDMLE